MTGSSVTRERGRRVAFVGAVALAAWVAGLVVMIALLGTAGEGSLRTPAWDSVGDGDGVLLTFACLRLVALGLAWYLLAATAVGAVLRLTRTPRLVVLADGLTIPTVRRLLQRTVGIGVAGGLLIPSTAIPVAVRLPVAAAAAQRGPAPPHDRSTPPTWPTAGTAAVATGAAGEADPADTVTLRRLPDDPPATQRQWQVHAGESFWSIAERVVAGARSRPVSDAEVDGYWRHLVAVNRRALADPANADLIFPGQVFELPPV